MNKWNTRARQDNTKNHRERIVVKFSENVFLNWKKTREQRN